MTNNLQTLQTEEKLLQQANQIRAQLIEQYTQDDKYLRDMLVYDLKNDLLFQEQIINKTKECNAFDEIMYAAIQLTTTNHKNKAQKCLEIYTTISPHKNEELLNKFHSFHSLHPSTISAKSFADKTNPLEAINHFLKEKKMIEALVLIDLHFEELIENSNNAFWNKIKKITQSKNKNLYSRITTHPKLNERQMRLAYNNQDMKTVLAISSEHKHEIFMQQPENLSMRLVAALALEENKVALNTYKKLAQYAPNQAASYYNILIEKGILKTNY